MQEWERFAFSTQMRTIVNSIPDPVPNPCRRDFSPERPTAAPARLAADLVWSRETGWRMEGGALAGLTGGEGRNALDQMNRARSSEE